MKYFCRYASPLGEIVLITDGEALTHLAFTGQKYYDEYMTNARECFDLPVLAQTRMWLDRYFADDIPPFFPKINPSGTEFQRLVWSFLAAIPYGETVTYGDLAKDIAAVRGQARMSAQAVGHAVGRNPISILVPCHRVVGVGGALTGYAAGNEIKRRLLQLESPFFHRCSR